MQLDAQSLPYNTELVEELREYHGQGRKIILATASEQSLAEKVAQHLGLFAQVMGTTEEVNLKGPNKVVKLVALFGENKFDYVGDSSADLAIWEKSRKAILVNPSASTEKKARQLTDVERVYHRQTPYVKTFLKAIRVHQWAKNLLIFGPIAAGHELSNPLLVAQAVVAFFSFSFAASSVYLLNDLMDLKDDRQHKEKRNRPLAAGNLSLLHGMLAAPLLLALGFSLCLFLPLQFLLVLLGYYLITLSYTFYLKKIVLVDVMVLAGLYTIRLGAGGAAVSIAPSFWLLAFSIFIFLSLAMVKRYAELNSLKTSGGEGTPGRGYRVDDLSIIASLGTASGYVAVVILALYINGENAQLLYKTPEMIWLQCPILLFWVSRVWLKAHRGEMSEDPVVFAIKDRVSQLTVMLMAVVAMLATFSFEFLKF